MSDTKSLTIDKDLYAKFMQIVREKNTTAAWILREEFPALIEAIKFKEYRQIKNSTRREQYGTKRND